MTIREKAKRDVDILKMNESIDRMLILMQLKYGLKSVEYRKFKMIVFLYRFFNYTKIEESFFKLYREKF